MDFQPSDAIFWALVLWIAIDLTGGGGGGRRRKRAPATQ